MNRTSVFIFPILLVSALWSQSSQPSAVPALPADIPATADRYSFLLMGNLAGQQAVWTASDGTLHIFFQFNDRGRGPKTTSVLKLDSNGIPVSEVIHRQRLPEVASRLKPIRSKPAPRAGRTTTSKAKRKSRPPPSTHLSMVDPPKLRSSPTPPSRTEEESLCFPKAKPASSA